MLLTEFDPSSRAVIDPEMCVHPVEGLPEIAVFLLFSPSV